MTNIYTKLNQARKQFHSEKLKKSGHNKFAGYYYFELGDFIIPALQIFDQLGLIGMVSFGKEYATLDIIDCDKPDDRIQFTSPMSSAALKGCHEVQNLGAVQTYLRRYLWVAALEIVEHDGLNATQSDSRSTVFDVLEALDFVETALTLEALEKVWKDQSSKARKAANRAGYDALLAAVNDKKAELSK